MSRQSGGFGIKSRYDVSRQSGGFGVAVPSKAARFEYSRRHQTIHNSKEEFSSHFANH
jgi:hypothetical protein